LTVVVLAASGIVCFAISSLMVERPDGFFSVEVGPYRLVLPDAGLAGDAGTYSAEWGMLGLSCLGASTMAALYPWVVNRAARELVTVLLVIALMGVALFATKVL
jgi:hypothetical protein